MCNQIDQNHVTCRGTYPRLSASSRSSANLLCKQIKTSLFYVHCAAKSEIDNNNNVVALVSNLDKELRALTVLNYHSKCFVSS